MYKFLSCIAVCMFLSGCALMGDKPAESSPEASPATPVMQFMIENDPGASASLADDEFGGDVRVTIEESFLSAGNEMCKRATVFSGQQEAEIVVICRPAYSNDAAAWRLAPRVWGNGTR